MAYGRLGHDLYLCHEGCAVAVGCADAVASRVAAADDEHLLVFAVDDALGRDGNAFKQAVLLSEQLEGEMYAFEVTPFYRQIARSLRSYGNADGIERIHYILGKDLFPHHGVDLKAHAFLLHKADAAVDDVLAQLEVGYAEAEQAARQLVFLEDGHLVAFMVKTVGNGQSCRSAADYGNALAVSLRHDRLHEAFAECSLNDCYLVLSYCDRLVAAQLQHAAFLAKGRADPAGKLRKVARLRKQVIGFAPQSAIEEVLPLGLLIAQRTSPMAERNAAVHATRCLTATVAAVECLFYFAEVVDTIFYRTIACFLSVYGEECSWISHDVCLCLL